MKLRNLKKILFLLIPTLLMVWVYVGKPQIFGFPPKAEETNAAVAYDSAGAIGYSFGINVNYPASIASGDLLIMVIGMKPSTANSGSVTTPTGWTLITSLTGAGGYGSTLGADTGNTNVFTYYKVADGTETGSLPVQFQTSNVAWSQMYRLSNATKDWSVAGATGSTSTASTSMYIDFTSNPGVTTGDFILAGMVIPTDVTTPSQFSAEALSQTGVSFGTVTEISEPDSSLNNDIGGFVVRSSVSSGTGSANPRLSATAGGTVTDVRGPGFFIRVRATGAITYQSASTLSYSIGAPVDSILIPYPSSISSGNILIAVIGMKPSTANSGSVTTPTGWTLITSLTGAGGYGSTLGADTGNTNVFTYYKVADGTETGSLPVIFGTNNVSWGQIYKFSNGTGYWDIAGATGSTSTASTSMYIDFTSNPGVTTGDFILAGMVIPTDVTTPSQFSAEALSQTGVSFGTVTEISEPDTTIGNQIGGFVVRSSVSSGTGSANPRLSATAGGTVTDVRGPGFFIRIREVPAPVPGIPTFYNDDGGSYQVAFNNIRSTSTAPIFRVSATSAINFNRFQLELNTNSNFSGIAYTQTFTGTYSSQTQYNITANSLSPSLPTTDGVTYYVRVRASANGGSTWGNWSTTTWTFTYKSSGNPDWFQTVNEQFNTGTLVGVTATSNSVSLPGTINATGGTVTTSGGYKQHVFTSNGTFSVTGTSTTAQVLVVAGGGGGGSGGQTGGGGGGAGGLIYDSAYFLPLGDISVVVGEGGAGGIRGGNPAFGVRGGTSTFDTIFAVGGGGGMTPENYGASATSSAGGSGGGGSGYSTGNTGGIGTVGQGNNGGNGVYISTTNYAGGGGGGAGGAGVNGSGTTGGNGGAGLNYSSIFGTGVGASGWFAGGGGGAAYTTQGTGQAGGGNGVSGVSGGTSALANTGSGGGGGTQEGSGGNGGSGIVIIRYPNISTGTIVSSPINFNSVPGMKFWGDVIVNATTTASSSIVIEVLNSAQSLIAGKTCTLNGDNSCFISLYDISTTSNNSTIYLKATLTDSGSIPYLNDWSVTWATTTPNIPGKPVFYSTDGNNQIAFNNIKINSTSPSFRISATSSENFNRFQIELNTASNFSGTAYIQTFSGVYASGTAYNLTLNSLSPSLPTTDGATYYVRARASRDGGVNYSSWSSEVWSYTYKDSGDPEWFQTTDDQFNTDNLSNTETNGSGAVRILGNSAIFYTDFSEYETGSKPSDWTRRWQDDTLAWIVRDDSTSTGGKILAVEGAAGSSRKLLSWDILNSISADVDIFFIYKLPANNQDAFAAARGSGGVSGDTTVMRAGYNTTSNGKEIARYTAGSFTRISSITNFTPSVDTWYKARANFTGNSHKYKTWLATDNEPVTWDLESTDSNVTAAGWIGLHAFVTNGTGASFDIFGVNVSGGSAPTSSITIKSPIINFNLVPGMSNWGQASWSETETNGSVSMQVYYATSTDCNTLVPDNVLSGNSVGITSSPINLSSLSTSTYANICLVAKLRYSGGSPTLNDWSISWGGGGTPNINQLNYRWRYDDGNETNASFIANTNTPVTSGIYVGDKVRLRFLLSNTGNGNATNYQYRLQYASMANSCSVWTDVPVSSGVDPWIMDLSNYVSDGITTSDNSGITNPVGKNFVSGYFKSGQNQTSIISLSPSEFTELEYTISSTAFVAPGVSYCFRLNNAGSTNNFTYSVRPEITVSVVSINRRTGGSSIESVAPPGGVIGGGGSGGGTGTEQIPTTTTPTSTTTPGQGGGGDVGLFNEKTFLFATVAFAGRFADDLIAFIKKVYSVILNIFKK